MKIRNQKHVRLYWDIVALLILSILSVFFIIYRLGNQYILLKILLSTFFVFSTYSAIIYAIHGRAIFNKAPQSAKKTANYRTLILLAIILTYLPIMINGYFFHDDWLNFVGEGFLEYSITQARPVTGLFTDLVGSIKVDNSWILGVIAVIGLIIFVEIIFEFLKNFLTCRKALLISLLTGFIAPIINVVSYKCMYIYIYAAVFSALSTIFFYQGMDKQLNTKRRIFFLISGFVFICYANMIYQVTATTAFYLIAILCLYGKKDKEITTICYLPYYMFSTLIYYVTAKLLPVIYNTELLSRGTIISNFGDIYDKIIFFCDVLSENVKQVISSFTYNFFFYDHSLIGKLEYKNSAAEILLMMFICLLIVICIFCKLVKPKRWLSIFTLALVVPLSYYPFLILKEDSYSSYYSISLCAILLLFCIEGSISVIRFFNLFCFWKKIAILLCCIEMISANIYMNKFWVGSNKGSYDHIIHELNCNLEKLDKTKWIHIYGTVKAGQADIYAIKETKRAIEEMGIENSIKITTSSNKYYCNVVSYETFESMKNYFTNQDMALWKELYSDNSDFSIYTIKHNQLSEEQKNYLVWLFDKCNVIPSEGRALSIYLNIEK